MLEDSTKRSAFVWVLWGLIALVLVGGIVSSVVTVIFWERIVIWSNTWGNVVSVLGMGIGLIAFLLTIFSLAITHRTEKEARNRIQQTLANAADAVKKAQEETREAIADASSSVAAIQTQMREIVT